jgi:hypothetical protein
MSKFSAMDLSVFSDLYKDINGVRPRGSFTDEQVQWWFDNHDRLAAEELAQEAQQLVLLGEMNGRVFANYSEYYDFLEAREYEEYLADKAEKAAAEMRRIQLLDPRCTLHAIEAWAHGEEMLLAA